tara:strand:- start:1662 stop:1877 length:216 start_codon:yes stop_codon:yes gene_type:complete
MKDKINEIVGKVESGHLEPNEATSKLFDLLVVSQQRELLKAYDKFAEMEHAWFIGTEEETKEKFLVAFNCG